jgi:hypothetical protein
MHELAANLASAKICSQPRELEVPPPRAVACMLGSLKGPDKLTHGTKPTTLV